MPYSPRQVALDLLNTLYKSPFHLDRIMENMVEDGGEPSKRDRNLVNAIVFGVLRWRNFLDWIIFQLSSSPIEKINPEILNILRIGLFQIFFLDRIPVSAAVNTSVDMAKEIAPPWIAGYVNAILRNAFRKKNTLPYPRIDLNPEIAIPIIKSFPEWLVNRWLDRYGTENTLKLCDACNEIPALTCRTNTLRINRDALFDRLAQDTEKIFLTGHSPDGLSFHNPKKAVHHLTAFKDGFFQIQDEAAQLISLLLSPRAGEFVLDACAGLGGKTGHIAQLMKDDGQLVAMDKDPQKISRLNEEMKRLGIRMVSSKILDLEKPFTDDANMKFDKILLDAPCSGLGVIRRNPDIKWDASRQNLNQYHVKQLKLLDHVGHMVKPYGIIVYAVCSFEPEENEMVVNQFLRNHSNFAILKNYSHIPFKTDTFFDHNCFFRTLPHIHHMDGFFAACLKRME